MKSMRLSIPSGLILRRVSNNYYDRNRISIFIVSSRKAKSNNQDGGMNWILQTYLLIITRPFPRHNEGQKQQQKKTHQNKIRRISFCTRVWRLEYQLERRRGVMFTRWRSAEQWPRRPGPSTYLFSRPWDFPGSLQWHGIASRWDGSTRRCGWQYWTGRAVICLAGRRWIRLPTVVFVEDARHCEKCASEIKLLQKKECALSFVLMQQYVRRNVMFYILYLVV